MSAPTLPTPALPASAAETSAGSYFISNYPPYSCWSAQHLPAAHAALERVPDPGTLLGVYVHIPFCRKRCTFCYFRVVTGADSTQTKAYVDHVIRELEMYASRPAIAGRAPRFVYFGGGTPSYLSVEQINRLAQALRRHLPWESAEEITFEGEPGTLTEAKLQALKQMGVTRLSLGVESWDDGLLEANGRAHRSAEAQRAFDWAAKLGFQQLNIDLIAGLVGATDENWRTTVTTTLAKLPDSVTIYQLEVPYNTLLYKEAKAHGQTRLPVADWETKRRWVRYAFEEFEKAGYAVSSGYTVVRNPQKMRFVYRDYLWRGADLLGLGVASFSHIGGVHFQNLPDMEKYLPAVQAGQLPIGRAHALDQEQKLIRELILQLKLGRVEPEYFAQKFQVDTSEHFKSAWAVLQQRGHLLPGGPGMVLTRDALLQVDALLPYFFQTQHQNVRYT